MKQILKLIAVALCIGMVSIAFASNASDSNQGIVLFTTFVALSAFSLFMAPKGVLSSTPAATSGDYSASYISLQDIGMPKWYSKLVNTYGDQGAEFVGMLQAMGWTSKASTALVQHWEDDWVWDNFTVDAQAGGAAGANVTLTIQATSILNGKFFPVVGDIIEFPATGGALPVQARVESVGANTIVVKPGKATWAIPATTAGQALFVGTNLSAEGTGQPTAKRTSFNLYQNRFVRPKSTVEMTGDAMTEELKWAEYELVSGKKATGIVNQSTIELDFMQMKSEQYAFLSGNTYDQLTQDGKTISGTEGLFPALKRAAIPYGYSVWGMAAYDNIEKSLSSVYAGQITGLLQGINLDIASENILADYLKHTNVDYITKTSNAALFGDNEGLAVSVGFSYIEKAKRKFAMKRFTALQDPKQYGTTGYDYLNRAIAIPLKKNNVDPNTKAKIPTMRTVYRSMDGYDRQKEMFTTGSANAAKYGNTNDVDNRVLNCRSQFAPEFFAVAQYVDIFQQ